MQNGDHGLPYLGAEAFNQFVKSRLDLGKPGCGRGRWRYANWHGSCLANNTCAIQPHVWTPKVVCHQTEKIGGK